MRKRTEDIRKPSSFNRHTEAWRCKFTCYSVDELTQSLPFGALQYTDHHTQSSVKKTGLSFFFFLFPLGDSSKHFFITASRNACENRESQSCFYLTVTSITSQMKLVSKSDMEKSLHPVCFHTPPWQKLSNPGTPCCRRFLWVQWALKQPSSHERQRANSLTIFPSTTIT